MISAIVTQTMTSADQSEEEDKPEREQLLLKLNAVHEAILRYSMRQSFQS